VSVRPPCPTCPWRVGQHADEIPGFRLGLAEELKATTSDQFGAPIFACHQSKLEKEVICVGWLWRYGWDSIAIRLKLMRGDMTPYELEPDLEIELHETWEEMMVKLRDDCA
jgi:Family of unknown function (DUF6283)